MSVVVCLNVVSSTISETSNVPLYADDPAPVILVSLVTFLTVILSPTSKPCGCSARTVTTEPETVLSLMNLGFLL